VLRKRAVFSVQGSGFRVLGLGFRVEVSVRKIDDGRLPET
jgi:hypothetical protein